MFEIMLCFLIVYYGKYIILGYLIIMILLTIIKRL